MDISMAFDRFDKARRHARIAVYDLAEHHYYRVETGFPNNLCASSCNAAEFLAKAVAHMRGFNPQKTHNVNALCAELEDHDPNDRLVPVLLRLNGVTHRGHVKGAYDMSKEMVEPLSKSETRLVRVMGAFRELLDEAARVCRRNPAQQRDFMNGIGGLLQAADSWLWRGAILDLARSDCPKAVSAGIERGRSRFIEFGNQSLGATA